MRVIRPAALTRGLTLPTLLPALVLAAAGAVAGALAVVLAPTSPVAAAAFGIAGVLGVVGGLAALFLARRPEGADRDVLAIEALIRDAFDDSYTLILAPRLPLQRRGLSALLVGPAGLRVLTVRDWAGRFRVRGRTWEISENGRERWTPAAANPSVDVAVLVDGVSRWATAAGLHVPVSGAIVFPRRRSRVVLEEPEDEIVTTENVPWWANRIGRVQRLDGARVAQVVSTVIEESERA
jgi:hypothetical protein